MTSPDVPDWHSSAGLTQLRSLYGRATEYWASERVVVEESRWLAISGVASALFNEGVCHGPGGGDRLADTVEEILAAGFPATISVAGEALRDVRRLVAVGWACVEAQPLMARRLDDLAPDPQVRRLSAADLPAARSLVEDAYQLQEHLTRCAVPDTAVETPGHAGWGLFDGGDMVSYMGTAVVDGAAVVWSMATPIRYQQRGYGARLLNAALAGTRDDGATYCVLRSSSVGEPLYRRTGFEVLEWWQVWSRPRWVLSRD